MTEPDNKAKVIVALFLSMGILGTFAYKLQGSILVT